MKINDEAILWFDFFYLNHSCYTKSERVQLNALNYFYKTEYSDNNFKNELIFSNDDKLDCSEANQSSAK